MIRAFLDSLSPTKSRATTVIEEEDEDEEEDEVIMAGILEDEMTVTPPPSTTAPSSSYRTGIASSSSSSFSSSSRSGTYQRHPHHTANSSSSGSHSHTNTHSSRSRNHSNTSYYDSYQHRLFDHLDSEFDPSLDESEILELGMSNEMLSDELYLPSHPSRDWIRCYISSTGPGTYRMYLEGKRRVRFLMSAKQFSTGATFLISSNEDFPILEMIPKVGYIARLEKQKDLSYLLCLNYCHLCDSRLGCFTCGRGGREREVIAKISHHFRLFRPVNLQYRCVNVYIPSISRSGKRKIWCPRSFRLAYGDTLSPDVDVNTAISTDRQQESYMIFRNKLPEWNQDLQSLVVKFHGNRILTASARNFLLCANLSESTTTGSSILYCSDEEDEETLLDDVRNAYAKTQSQQQTRSNNNNAPNSGNGGLFIQTNLPITSGPESGSSSASHRTRQFATIQAIQSANTPVMTPGHSNGSGVSTVPVRRKHSESFDSNLTWNPLALQQQQQQQQLKASRSRSRGNSVGSTPKVSKRKTTTVAPSIQAPSSLGTNAIGIATPATGNSPSSSGPSSVASSPQQQSGMPPTGLKRHNSMPKPIVPAPNYPGECDPNLISLIH
jgi:hypothetical protein